MSPISTLGRPAEAMLTRETCSRAGSVFMLCSFPFECAWAAGSAGASAPRSDPEEHGLLRVVEHHEFCQLGRLEGTTPRERDPRTAVAVVVDDAGAGLGLEPDVALAEWTQADPDGLVGIDLRRLEDGQEVPATGQHVAHRPVVVQPDVEP